MQDALTQPALRGPEPVSYASSVARLPGDVIITGSPAGNGSHWGRFLKDGDVMDVTIEGLGMQRTPVVAASGEPPPWQASRQSKAPA